MRVPSPYQAQDLENTQFTPARAGPQTSPHATRKQSKVDCGQLEGPNGKVLRKVM